MSAPVRQAGEPDRCRCARAVVATVGETLDCPAPWWYMPGTGWCHVLGSTR